MRRSFVVSALAASILGLGATPAVADHAPDPDGGWEAAPEDFYAPIETQACGETVTLESGDVREVEIRVTEFAGGIVFTEYRGGATFDILDEDGKLVVDELDISGIAYEIAEPDGTLTIVLYGASVLFTYDDPIDRAAFEEAGLPDIAYFEDPQESATIVIETNPDDGAVESAEFTDIDAEIVDLCKHFRGHEHDHDPEEEHEKD